MDEILFNPSDSLYFDLSYWCYSTELCFDIREFGLRWKISKKCKIGGI